MPPPARRRALPSSCHRRPRGLVLQGGARHWTEAATWCRAARPRSCPGFWVQACRTAHRMTTALRRAARRGRRFSVNDPCFCIIGGMIAIRNLSMRLVSGGREVSILDDISLDVPAKQFLAIVGPSGSGKSTLLGLIGGMDTPTSGTISIDRLDITKLSDDELSRLRLQKIGFVFQSFHLIPTLTARENIAVPMEMAGDPEANAKADELLRAVGLESRGHHYPVQLSGCEQQRVADEPTGNLDTTTGEQVIELIIRLNRDRGSTLVLVTHDPALAAHADRIVLLRDGRIASDDLRHRAFGAHP